MGGEGGGGFHLKRQTWSAGALPRQGSGEITGTAVASGGCPGCMDARCKLRRNLLLHIVPQHGKDLLHKGIKLLLEQQGWVLGLDLQQCDLVLRLRFNTICYDARLSF